MKTSMEETVEEIPQLRMGCSVQADGSLEVLVQSMNDEFEYFYSPGTGHQLAGKSVRILFAEDQFLVDSWLEFLLKAINGWCCNAQEGRVKFSGLQFLQRLKNWYIVALEYQMDSGQALATFMPTEGGEESLHNAYLRDINQKLWLNRFVDRGGSWEIDQPSQNIYLCRHLAQTLQLAQDAAIVPVSAFLAIVHPEDSPRVVSALANVVNERYTISNRGVLKDGSKIYFNSYAVPGYDSDGKFSRVVGYSQNVTEKEQAAEKLAISEQRFRGIIENSLDIYVVVSPGGYLQYVSANIAQYTGYRKDEIVGSKFRAFMGCKEDEARLINDFRRLLAGEVPHTQGEFLIKIADSSTVWFSISMSLIGGDKDDEIEVAAVCRDISHEKIQNEKAEYWSNHDALTGAHNRFYFENQLNRIQREALRNVGLIALDVNGLKLTNDAFGHQRGDDLLVEATGVLRKVCAGRHSICRVGGDEFAVIAHNVTLRELEWIGECVDRECSKTANRDVPLNLSWGIAHRSDLGESPQQLYTQAESSMFSNKLLESRSVRSHVLSSLKVALRARNLETADHTLRMENMVVMLGRRLGLSSGEFDRLVLLASMHDIGKVAIPDNIINKPGPLNEEEWVTMRTHSELGARIAQTSQELSIIAHEIASHHERWDGRGYPMGLQQEEIPLLARIINVVDAYDVMTHKRVYKEALSHEKAIDELQCCAGTQFDPEITQLFLDIFGSLSQQQMQAFTNGERM